MLLAATSALTLRAASALTVLTLLKGFFNLNKMLKKMNEFFKDKF